MPILVRSIPLGVFSILCILAVDINIAVWSSQLSAIQLTNRCGPSDSRFEEVSLLLDGVKVDGSIRVLQNVWHGRGYRDRKDLLL